MIYKPKFFQPYELLPPEYGNSYYWLNRLMSPTVLYLADQLRRTFGKVVVNDGWKENQLYKDSGFRSIKSWKRMYPNKPIEGYDTWGSVHPRGLALDLKFQDVDTAEIFEQILKDKDYWYTEGLRRVEAIELTTGKWTTWLHIDVLDTDYNELVVVDYVKAYTINEYQSIRHTL